ncbi:hypothetical protein [Myxococcus fulvus]|uniref:hypothetical protein n=1 Tax=Myxococcus TaxID=32 RepID=UPI0020C0DB65|nr:hypothetical protein [Myxococcus fulvus]MCK8499789.1 hypothetical protein [Myxococcus fulvus]BDT38781.1 hypothetical protein MFMH1_84500 [Myxococcus sp. MH1]
MPPHDDATLSDISKRWKSALLIESWRSLPAASREEVLADMEDSARTLRDHDPKLSESYVAAMDALDVVGLDGTLHLWTQATDDVRHLLDEITRLRAELQRERTRLK